MMPDYKGFDKSNPYTNPFRNGLDNRDCFRYNYNVIVFRKQTEQVEKNVGR